MNTQIVTAMFDDYASAANAVSQLKAVGISESDISLISNDTSERARYETVPVDAGGDAATGAGTGATIGGVLGGGAGLLAGLGLLAIPGVGPVVAAGWLAATLVGAGAGVAAGGLLGGLTGAGIGERDAHVYAEGVRRGGSLVTVKASEGNLSRVEEILENEGTVDLVEREENWRVDGWTGRYEGEAVVDRDPRAASAVDEEERRRRVRTYPVI